MLKAEEYLSASLNSTLHSYTMVFFSKNRLLGLLLLIVSFFDLYAGLAGILAVAVSNGCAWLLGLNRSNIIAGYYGFNALLVGLGLGMAFQPTAAFFLILIFVSLATLFITLGFEGLLGKYGLPYLTFPFLISLWIALLATRSYTALLPGEANIFTLNSLYGRGGPMMVKIYDWFGNVDWPPVVETYFKSLGAIFFQEHLLAGLLVAAGLLIASRISFLLSVLGFACTWFFYSIIGADIHQLDYSFIGFNHILTAIAIGGFFMVASRWSLLWVILLTPIISILISGSFALLAPWQLPVYSLPFNLLVVLFLYGMKFRERMLLKPEVVAVQHFSPEKNLYLSLNARQRFRNQHYIALELPFFGTWTVNQGHNGKYTHKEEWRHAWDFVIRDEKESEYDGSGQHAEDYHCFGKPVLAPADGWVEEVVDSVEDNTPGDFNVEKNWGNTIIIKHSDWLYTKLSHLKKGSTKVTPGTFVSKGQVLAACGNSGHSPFPHLHFQVQSTPHIGSATLRYPFSQYILHSNGSKLRLYHIPEVNEQIGNIETEPSLLKAFHFIPGQTITLQSSHELYNTSRWKIGSDMLKNRFITDEQTGAKAYFISEGAVFYFTHFEGKRKCLLYYFFLAAYKLPLGYYKNLEVDDLFPPSILPYSPLLLIQDIVAPFVIFVKPRFRLGYVSRDEDLAGSRIELQSSCLLRFGDIEMRNFQFKLTIAENKLHTFTIDSAHLKLTATLED